MVKFDDMRIKCKLYKKLSNKLIKIFDNYSIEDEIYILTKEQKNIIKFYINFFSFIHVEKYGYLDDENYNLYLLIEILNYFDVHLYTDVDQSVIKKYEYHFKEVAKDVFEKSWFKKILFYEFGLLNFS